MTSNSRQTLVYGQQNGKYCSLVLVDRGEFFNFFPYSIRSYKPHSYYQNIIDITTLYNDTKENKIFSLPFGLYTTNYRERKITVEFLPHKTLG